LNNSLIFFHLESVAYFTFRALRTSPLHNTVDSYFIYSTDKEFLTSWS